MSQDFIQQIPNIIKELYRIVNVLERNFPGLRFTLDGHLVGSLGEVIASYYYDLKLLPPSSGIHDATTRDGKLVQIKATQIDKIAIRHEPEHLLVLKILGDGSFMEVYNGPGNIVWRNTGPKQSNGQSYIRLSKLGHLMEDVGIGLRLPRVRSVD